MRITNKYVLFWDGVFSQWYPSIFVIDGVTYTSAEQYMMQQKALLFGDTETAEKIMAEHDQYKQKMLGREVKNFNDTIWKKNCFSIVYKGNLAKFTQNEDIKQFLIETGDRIIVEASSEDFIWGIGEDERNLGIEDVANWSGTNLLGFALMMVRHKIVKG